MQYLMTSREIKEHFQISDFVLKTQEQIAKDFSRSGYLFCPEFSLEEKSFEEISEKVNEMLSEVMHDGEGKLLQLLYQIDLPQKEFLELLHADNLIDLLAEKIIRREAYKVFLRSKF